MDELQDTRREQARKRVERRRAFQEHLATYVVVNAFLVGIWAMTGHDYFWPGWILGGWGIGLVLDGWNYLRGPITEADVDRELHRMG